MTTERDTRTGIVLSWLREDAHEDAERVLLQALDEVDATPQRRSWWPARRSTSMHPYAKLLVAAAAVLVLAFAGYRFGPAATNPTPTGPRLPLLARGNFEISLGTVSIHAVADGSRVEGRLFVNDPDGSLEIDIRCTRTTEDGLIMIGGSTSAGIPAGIVFKRGSPVQATVWSEHGRPASKATDCLAFLDEQLQLDRSTGGVPLEPVVLSPDGGYLELGVSGTVDMSLLGATLLARGTFTMNSRPVELEAMAAGATVTGRMTVALPFGSLDGVIVDLQCARSTADGRLLIGGYVIHSENESWARVGSLVGIGLMRGSPVRAAVWLRRSEAPILFGTTCAAGLEAQLAEDPTSGGQYMPIGGNVELGPAR